MQTKILLVTDYRNYFYSSTKAWDVCMDVKKIAAQLSNWGAIVTVCRYDEIDFAKENYSGYFVLYQSSEDPGLHYKSYIEDVLLGFVLQGAILIPRFSLFRAHHNKVFMEVLRNISQFNDLKNIESKYYGTYEEFVAHKQFFNGSYVLKPSAGALSSGVTLFNAQRDSLSKIAKISDTSTLFEKVKQIVKKMVRSAQHIKSIHRGKFVIQNFIPGLKHDYKVLVYGTKYFVLHRKVRNNDFRASGSGLFNLPVEVPEGLLDFAEKLYIYFDVPFISLDIAHDGEKYIAIEFQFVMFGNITLEQSKHHFTKKAGMWTLVSGTSDLEEVFSRSIVQYIDRLSHEVTTKKYLL
jgi:glutathione synthase/RimK-type ligase-like ATP-grasp enzyme